MASEEGEIPEKEEATRNGADEEVLAATVVDENDEEASEGSDLVVAKVVDDELAASETVAADTVVPPTGTASKAEDTTPQPMKKDEEEEEEGEVIEEPAVDAKPSDPPKGQQDTEVATPSPESETNQKDAIDSQVSANKPAEKSVKDEEAATHNQNDNPKPHSENNYETTQDSRTADDEVDKAPPPASTTTATDMKAEDKEVEEGEMEEGELEEDPVPTKLNEEAVDETAQVKVDVHTAEPTPEDGPKDTVDKPSTMEVDELKVKVSESINEIRKGDDEEEEGEIKDDPVHEVELKEDTESDHKEDTEEEGEIKEDADMEDALSQSEEGGDRDVEMTTADGDTASVDGDDASIADETGGKKGSSYSTRGRSSGSNTPVPREHAKPSAASGAGATNEEWQRSVREALEGLGRSGSKEGTPAGVGPGGASFLEALTEEERRTRTRFLPAVDGIHMLRKNEIKGDLALSRSIMSNSGHVASVASVAAGAAAVMSTSKKSKKKKHDGDVDGMDVDDGGAMSSSEDDPAMDGSRVNSSSTIEVDDGDVLVVPSTAFTPPPAATHSSSLHASSNGERSEDGAPPVSTGVKGILNNQRNIKSPRVVESVTAFNPPRPPESVGKKKQHRMLRWERRPADVELDLNSYRKTVDRTRKELHTEEAELERIEATSNHMRRHFMAHLRCIDDEMDQIMGELNSVQQKCVNAADLLTSRTRSRGAGKGSYVMRDVLGVLKARGAELNEKGLSLRSDVLSSKHTPLNYPGMGGVGASSFSDWNERTTFPPSAIASSWVLPDDRVETPYGEGVVTGVTDSTVSVRMAFGVGHFNPASVTSKESPNTLSDAKLAKRWRGIIDTAELQASLLDVNAMTSIDRLQRVDGKEKKDGTSGTNGGAGAMHVDGHQNDEPGNNGVDPDEIRLLPFGSSLLPTGSGRGNQLFDMSITQLQQEFQSVLADGVGVLGKPANEGVPTHVKDFEKNSQESYILQAKVLQLRNELYRQRRIRTLNEKTFTATKDRATRVEGLVAEMRTDLNSLKYRLDEELKELGIDQDRAEVILKAYYTSHDYAELDLHEEEPEGSPNSKRSRECEEQPAEEAQKEHENGSAADGDSERQTKRPKLAS